MSIERPSHRHGAFALVRQFARRRSETEQCELCGRSLATEHQHLIEPPTRKLACVCDACAVLFSGSQQKYARVPRDVERLDDFRITDAQWDSLQIPVGIAFFFFNSALGRMVVFYPGPAGATESLLALETWDELVKLNPALETLGADVEALLVRNLKRRENFDCYIVPIDACYELVGRIRRCWKGFDGGEDAWNEIDGFFADLRVRSGETSAEAGISA